MGQRQEHLSRLSTPLADVDLYYGNNILDSVAPWVENPYKLISLGDFMEIFDGSKLVRLGFLIDQTTVLAQSDRDLMPEHWWVALNAALSATQNDCEALGLVVTVAAIRRLERRVHTGDKDLNVVFGDLEYISGQLKEELGSCLFLHVPPAAADYITNPQEGWQSTLDKFPSTMLNVEEGSKCFALGRYTASVFHTMRVLEAGITALAKVFGVSADRTTWHVVINSIESEITKNNKSLGAGWPDQQFYSEAATQFRHFKDAWRNHVMHARLDFNEEQARAISDHVRDFMTHLSTKLKESP